MTGGSCADYQRRVSDSFGQGREYLRGLQNIVRVYRGTRFFKGDIVRVDQTEFGEPEVTHRPRDRADVQRVAGRDEDDFS